MTMLIHLYGGPRDGCIDAHHSDMPPGQRIAYEKPPPLLCDMDGTDPRSALPPETGWLVYIRRARRSLPDKGGFEMLYVIEGAQFPDECYARWEAGEPLIEAC